MIARLVLAVLIAAVACGEGPGTTAKAPEAPAAKAEPAEAVPAAAQAQDEALRKMNELLEWPAEKGPARDLAADMKSCEEELKAKPEYDVAAPFMRVIMQLKCLADLGWEKREQPGPQ